MTIPPKIRYPYRWVNPQSEYPDNRDIFVILHVRSEEQWLKILSCGLEGAYLMYPDDHHDVSVPLIERDLMDCTQIALCLLTNEEFLDSLARNPVFMSALNGQITQAQLVDGQNNVSDNSQVKDLIQTTSDKDAVWSGCFELTEYCLDLLKALCFFLQGVTNIVGLAQQLYDKQKRKNINFQAQDELNNGVNVSVDGELVNTSGATYEFVPNFLGQLVQTVSESAMVSFLTTIINIGVNFILADINDTRAESIACEFFNKITCNGETPKEPPYSFDNEVFFSATQGMIGNTNVGLAGNAIGACAVVVNLVNSFVSLFDLGECHRNYRIGMRSPSDEWLEICENCNPPSPTWSFTFNFTQGANGFSSRVAGASVLVSSGWVSSGTIYANPPNQYKESGCSRVVNLLGANIRSVTVNYIGGSTDAFGAWQVNVGSQSSNLPKGLGILSFSRTFTTPITGNGININSFIHFRSNISNTACAIQSITLSGDGDNPFD